MEEVFTALRECWRDIPVKVEREANGNAILHAASFLGCSAVVMCGTGSTAVGDTEDGRVYSGGWGPVYGDGGSGGGMGSEALKLFLRSVDRMAEIGELGRLFEHLKKGLNVKEISVKKIGDRRRNVFMYKFKNNFKKVFSIIRGK